MLKLKTANQKALHNGAPMNRMTFYLLLAAGVAGCSSPTKDSTAKADSINMTKDSGQKTLPLTHTQEISGDDARFAVKAAAGGMLEVELGKLAQQKSSNASVKAFGEMMVKDHSKANIELKGLAKSKHIVLPDTLSGEGMKTKAELSGKSGADFDKAYADLMVKDHQDDIDEFEKGAKVVKYPEMIAFADKTLPILKMHLDAAKKVQAELKSK